MEFILAHHPSSHFKTALDTLAKPKHSITNQQLPKNTSNQPATPHSINSSCFILKNTTINLLNFYYICNPNYNYKTNNNPRRVLTKPSKPSHNDGFDNEDWDYILYVGDILGSQESQQYRILDILGQGTFGQVVKCENLKTMENVAIKVIKNKPAYYNQSLVEVAILEMLNSKYDKDDRHHLARMKDTFVYRNHLCIIFEMLSVNLYELIKQNQFRGLSTNLVRVFVSQILDALVILQRAKIIHCDLKPENILLKNLESPSIKVIDFGSACHENQTIYTYIQSRFYRSPEVLLGVPYTSSIDMWSVGCIAAELFLGLPLFPGSSQYNQVKRIVEMLGVPPTYICEKGKSASEFFDKSQGSDGKIIYSLKSMETYMAEQKLKELPSKKYFAGITLSEIIDSYPIMRKGLPENEIERGTILLKLIHEEMNNRRSFLDFLCGLLNMNPLERWSPQQAIQHPFITGETYSGPFIPSLKTHKTHNMIQSEGSANPQRRPRASTISSSKVQNVPPHLQRLVAMQQLQNQSIPSTLKNHSKQNSPDFQHSKRPNEIFANSRRNSKNNLSPFTSKLAVYDSNEKNLQAVTGNLADIHFSQSFYEQNNTSVSDPFAAIIPLQKSNSQNQNSLDRYAHQKFSTSHGSFDDFLPHTVQYGEMGERQYLPSRVPSAATSADWEIFDDLDCRGPYYAVSPSISIASSAQLSRRASMMDLGNDQPYPPNADSNLYSSSHTSSSYIYNRSASFSYRPQTNSFSESNDNSCNQFSKRQIGPDEDYRGDAAYITRKETFSSSRRSSYGAIPIPSDYNNSANLNHYGSPRSSGMHAQNSFGDRRDFQQSYNQSNSISSTSYCNQSNRNFQQAEHKFKQTPGSEKSSPSSRRSRRSTQSDIRLSHDSSDASPVTFYLQKKEGKSVAHPLSESNNVCSGSKSSDMLPDSSNQH